MIGLDRMISNVARAPTGELHINDSNIVGKVKNKKRAKLAEAAIRLGIIGDMDISDALAYGVVRTTALNTGMKQAATIVSTASSVTAVKAAFYVVNTKKGWAQPYTQPNLLKEQKIMGPLNKLFPKRKDPIDANWLKNYFNRPVTLSTYGTSLTKDPDGPRGYSLGNDTYIMKGSTFQDKAVQQMRTWQAAPATPADSKTAPPATQPAIANKPAPQTAPASPKKSNAPPQVAIVPQKPVTRSDTKKSAASAAKPQEFYMISPSDGKVRMMTSDDIIGSGDFAKYAKKKLSWVTVDKKWVEDNLATESVKYGTTVRDTGIVGEYPKGLEVKQGWFLVSRDTFESQKVQDMHTWKEIAKNDQPPPLEGEQTPKKSAKKSKRKKSARKKSAKKKQSLESDTKAAQIKAKELTDSDVIEAFGLSEGAIKEALFEYKSADPLDRPAAFAAMKKLGVPQSEIDEAVQFVVERDIKGAKP